MIITGPQYTKDAAGTISYRFEVSSEGVAIHQLPVDPDITTYIHMDHATWFSVWMTEFLCSTAKHFSKPYTAQQLQRITQHLLNSRPDLAMGAYTLQPAAVTFRGGKCEVEWSISVVPMVIDIPDLEDGAPVKEAQLEEVDEDALPVAINATEIDQARLMDRQRLKEARLKAKIALYRVQHQMAVYHDRYGASVSEDSDDSESEASEASEWEPTDLEEVQTLYSPQASSRTL